MEMYPYIKKMKGILCLSGIKSSFLQIDRTYIWLLQLEAGKQKQNIISVMIFDQQGNDLLAINPKLRNVMSPSILLN